MLTFRIERCFRRQLSLWKISWISPFLSQLSSTFNIINLSQPILDLYLHYIYKKHVYMELPHVSSYFSLVLPYPDPSPSHYIIYVMYVCLSLFTPLPTSDPIIANISCYQKIQHQTYEFTIPTTITLSLLNFILSATTFSPPHPNFILPSRTKI